MRGVAGAGGGGGGCVLGGQVEARVGGERDAVGPDCAALGLVP